MPVPTYDKFIEPVLRFLAANQNEVRARDVYEGAADLLGLTKDERNLLLPSGAQAIYKNRVGWAHDRLKRAGLSHSPRRGYWQLTSKGVEFARNNPTPLTDDDTKRIATEFMDVRLRPMSDSDFVEPEAIEPSATESPDDRLESALAELRSGVADELLDALANVSPTFFETIVLDVLHKLGYGTSRSDLQRVGGAGDGGIDGVISLDKLGLEKVYVQAKRWQNSVGRPEVQAFYGALAGQRANKGVFITTSAFTPQARDFANSVEKIVLVNGHRLADLMIEYEVGVSSRIVRIPKLDSDYFDE